MDGNSGIRAFPVLLAVLLVSVAMVVPAMAASEENSREATIVGIDVPAPEVTDIPSDEESARLAEHDDGVIIDSTETYLNYWNEKLKWGLSEGDIQKYSQILEEQVLVRYYDADDHYYHIPDLDRFGEELGSVLGLSAGQTATFVQSHKEQLVKDYQNYHSTASVGEPIHLTIISPSEGSEAWIDVVPPHVAVVGEVDAPSGIESVVVRSETGEASCGNGTKFACSVPVSEGKNRIAITATDNLGNRAEKSRNVTVHIGLPPPPAITVSGRVTDPEGNAIPNASVRFESILMLDDENLSVTNTTRSDGRYLIENAIGYDQTIVVQKEGYRPFRREIVFGNPTNELDLELEPSAWEVPGFGLQAGIIGVLGALLILRGKNT